MADAVVAALITPLVLGRKFAQSLRGWSAAHMLLRMLSDPRPEQETPSKAGGERRVIPSRDPIPPSAKTSAWFLLPLEAAAARLQLKPLAAPLQVSDNLSVLSVAHLTTSLPTQITTRLANSQIGATCRMLVASVHDTKSDADPTKQYATITRQHSRTRSFADHINPQPQASILGRTVLHTAPLSHALVGISLAVLHPCNDGSLRCDRLSLESEEDAHFPH